MASVSARGISDSSSHPKVEQQQEPINLVYNVVHTNNVPSADLKQLIKDTSSKIQFYNADIKKKSKRTIKNKARKVVAFEEEEKLQKRSNSKREIVLDIKTGPKVNNMMQ